MTKTLDRKTMCVTKIYKCKDRALQMKNASIKCICIKQNNISPDDKRIIESIKQRKMCLNQDRREQTPASIYTTNAKIQKDKKKKRVASLLECSILLKLEQKLGIIVNEVSNYIIHSHVIKFSNPECVGTTIQIQQSKFSQRHMSNKAQILFKQKFGNRKK